MATDKIVNSLDTFIDQFVEIFIGKFGRPSSVSGSVHFLNMSENGVEKFIKSSIKYLQDLSNKHILNSTTDTDLLNIRDSIVADLNQLLYLFTLK